MRKKKLSKKKYKKRNWEFYCKKNQFEDMKLKKNDNLKDLPTLYFKFESSLVNDKIDKKIFRNKNKYTLYKP